MKALSTDAAVARVRAQSVNCQRSEEPHTVLTQDFQKVVHCQRLHLSQALARGKPIMIIIMSLKQMIVRFQFCGGYCTDNLASGCQRFLVLNASPTNHTQALAPADHADQLDQGKHHNASLLDYQQAIQEKGKVKFPNKVYEANIMIYCFAMLSTCFKALAPHHTRLLKLRLP